MFILIIPTHHHKNNQPSYSLTETAIENWDWFYVDFGVSLKGELFLLVKNGSRSF